MSSHELKVAQTAHRSTTATGTLSAFVRLGRPTQWTKNLIVFAALLFSNKLFTEGSAANAAAVFVAFCLLSSAVYALNDIMDIAEDRTHPVKKNRPVASGALSPAQAGAYAVVLAAISLGSAFLIKPVVGLICLLYAVINISYSNWLKHVVILDVMLVSSGFVLRAVAGAAALSVAVSPWLLLCTILLSLFLAMCKRRCEISTLAEGAGSYRKVLSQYSLPLLDQMISSTTAATVMAYCMYSFTSSAARHAPWLMLTVPFVIYGIFRYLYLVYRRGAGEEPERILISDRPLQLDIALWGITAGFIIYAV